MEFRATLLLTLFCCYLPAISQTESLETPPLAPEIFAEGWLSIPEFDELSISFPPDMNQLLFTRRGEGIFYSAFENGQWTDPTKVEVPGALTDLQYPMFSPSGDLVTFVDGNSKEFGHGDIYSFRLSGSVLSFDPVTRFPSPVTSTKREGGHSLTMDGDIYFTSGRVDSLNCGCSDVFRSRVINGSYQTAERMDAFNTVYDEESVFVSPDEAYVIVQSWRIGVEGKHNLYISYQHEYNKWTPLLPLDNSINSEWIEGAPFVSADQSTLFFRRGWMDNGVDANMYWVSTKRLFKPYQALALEPFDVQRGASFEIQLPDRLFRDYDDEEIEILFLSEIESLQFDSYDRTLAGRYETVGTKKVPLGAQDPNGNMTRVELVINVTP